MDIVLPGTTELIGGLVVFLFVQGMIAGLVAWDLKRRGAAAWWFVGTITLFLMPLGLLGWIVLRKPGGRSPARRRAG